MRTEVEYIENRTTFGVVFKNKEIKITRTPEDILYIVY